MSYVIGLDIGTSSVKGVLMTKSGAVKKTAHSSFSYRRLENGGVETDADEFVETCFLAIRELMAADDRIDAICASSASGNLIILDKENKPITPIFNWQDERVSTESQEVLGHINREMLYEKVGWPFMERSFPLALLCYIKKHSPEKLRDCGMVCMSTEYLYYKLTGKWGISTSAGTPFYLIEQKSGTYIPELLEVFGISEDKLPPIMSCGSQVGVVSEEASKKSCLPKGTPVVLGTFDHPSAARGAGVTKEGEMLLSCGTSWVAFLPLADREKAIGAKLLIDPFLSDTGGPWGVMVSVASVSERIRLYTKRYIDSSPNAYKILSQLAQKSSLGAGGLIISLLDEPNDEIIQKYPAKDIARAIMEGAVNLLNKKLNELRSIGISPKSAIMVGGPSEEPMYQKMIEEICGIKVEALHGANAGAIGAAMLARGLMDTDC